MASKQQQTKDKQGYEAKPVPKTCANCKSFRFDHVQTQQPSVWNKDGWWEDKNLRCDIGGFAVKKTATCNRFEMKEI